MLAHLRRNRPISWNHGFGSALSLIQREWRSAVSVLSAEPMHFAIFDPFDSIFPKPFIPFKIFQVLLCLDGEFDLCPGNFTQELSGTIEPIKYISY